MNIDNPKTLIAVYEKSKMFDIERIEASMGINWQEDVKGYRVRYGVLFLLIDGEWKSAASADRTWEDIEWATEILLVPERIEGGEE